VEYSSYWEESVIKDEVNYYLKTFDSGVLLSPWPDDIIVIEMICPCCKRAFATKNCSRRRICSLCGKHLLYDRKTNEWIEEK